MKMVKTKTSLERSVLWLVTCLYVLVVTYVSHEILSAPDLRLCQGQLCLSGSRGNLLCQIASTALWIYLKQALELQFEKLQEVEDKTLEVEMDDASKELIQAALQKSYWELKPCARVIGVLVVGIKSYERADGLYKIPGWQDGKRFWSYEAFVQNGLSFRNGNFIVSTPGIYRVYSNIHLQPPYIQGVGCPDVSDSQSLKHAISKFNIQDGKDVELTSATHFPKTPERCEYRCSFCESYIETICLLNAGDEISVHVSDLTFLIYPEFNYFGVTMM